MCTLKLLIGGVLPTSRKSTATYTVPRQFLHAPTAIALQSLDFWQLCLAWLSHDDRLEAEPCLMQICAPPRAGLTENPEGQSATLLLDVAGMYTPRFTDQPPDGGEGRGDGDGARGATAPPPPQPSSTRFMLPPSRPTGPHSLPPLYAFSVGMPRMPNCLHIDRGTPKMVAWACSA